MTDTEKIALISRMIADFWEFGTDERISAGADALVTAIYSVVEFESTSPEGNAHKN
jgi:hypothetical protein